MPNADLGKVQKAIMNEYNLTPLQDQDPQKKTFSDAVVKYLRVSLQHVIVIIFNKDQ